MHYLCCNYDIHNRSESMVEGTNFLCFTVQKNIHDAKVGHWFASMRCSYVWGLRFALKGIVDGKLELVGRIKDNIQFSNMQGFLSQ
jgi:hypothetical protein